MMMNRGMPGGYGGRPGRIMPMPMPPQDELPPDPNAPPMGTGMGSPLPGGQVAGPVMGGPPSPMQPMPPPPMMKPPMDDPMAAQGGAMGAGQAMAGRLGPGNGGMRGMIRQMLLRKMQGGS